MRAESFSLRTFFWRCFTISAKEQLINDAIRTPEMRVIGADGSQLGIMSRAEALNAAYDAGLDLVEISPNAEPPVCRIMDFGKYQFEKVKKEKESKKKHNKERDVLCKIANASYSAGVKYAINIVKQEINNGLE